MNKIFKILFFSFILVSAPHTLLDVSESSCYSAKAWAQEVDPIQEIQEFIQNGKQSIEKAKSRRLRKRSKTATRVKFYFEALKSFSSALRRLNEYQIEDDQLYEQIEESFNSVLGVKEVKKKISNLEGKLMSALKTKDFVTANQTAQDLIDLDERKETIKYLLPIISESLADE